MEDACCAVLVMLIAMCRLGVGDTPLLEPCPSGPELPNHKVGNGGNADSFVSGVESIY